MSVMYLVYEKWMAYQAHIALDHVTDFNNYWSKQTWDKVGCMIDKLFDMVIELPYANNFIMYAIYVDIPMDPVLPAPSFAD